MSQPERTTSTSYRNPTVDNEEDDDDLSDLDDVLASFNTTKPAPTGPAASSSTAPQPTTSQSSGSGAPVAGGDDEDFEASLMEGMESLLRQLAGDHPPGPMPGSTIAKPTSADDSRSGQLSKEAEEEAWQKAVEMVLSGEGLSAMGLDDKGKGTSDSPSSSSGLPSSSSPAPPASASGGGAKPSYEETLRKTMESLNSAGQKPSGSAGAGGPDLAALLASLGGDADLLKGLNLDSLGEDGVGGGEGEDGDLADVLEGMMAQLMTKEVLEEPMAELAAKYPPYLASPPSGVSPSDLEKYTKQHLLVQRITQTFKKSDYSDEKDGREIARLVSEMQDLGGPPKEVMGDLPEGFDLGALGSEEGCTIM
ncbi:hypothetical protein CI109_102960 [Kwoniella shandongensis]|uniref:Uncharacterized protein n=1 Tax=Kwoniella shandongensis TaxID=1734106 RepID=A0A5M6C837_9TREE|nr:uncharacterized protein CI109_000148 [Kwoniella shandongensis]KAA5531308.1 hypothetical protein CI109_000148 [Kwoniella shandongensis]